LKGCCLNGRVCRVMNIMIDDCGAALRSFLAVLTNKRYSYIFGSVKRMFIGMVVYTFTWHHLW